MPIPWFDNPKNMSGSLSTRLSLDCSTLNSLVTTFFSITIQSASTLITGVAIAFVFEWRTALTTLGFMPIALFNGLMIAKFTEGLGNKSDKVYKQSSKIINESMVNIRTVSSFNSEKIIEKRYK